MNGSIDMPYLQNSICIGKDWAMIVCFHSELKWLSMPLILTLVLVGCGSPATDSVSDQESVSTPSDSAPL